MATFTPSQPMVNVAVPLPQPMKQPQQPVQQQPQPQSQPAQQPQGEQKPTSLIFPFFSG